MITSMTQLRTRLFGMSRGVKMSKNDFKISSYPYEALKRRRASRGGEAPRAARDVRVRRLCRRSLQSCRIRSAGHPSFPRRTASAGLDPPDGIRLPPHAETRLIAVLFAAEVSVPRVHFVAGIDSTGGNWSDRVANMVMKRRTAWGLAEAKARLSEVLERAAREPQVIKRRGRAVGVVVDIEQFGEAQRRAMVGSAEQRMRAFLDASAAVRAKGGVALGIARREPRKSPFARR
jgi:prevent-host-death family protein